MFSKPHLYLVGIIVLGVVYVARERMKHPAQHGGAIPFDRFSSVQKQSTFPGGGKGQADAYGR